MRILDSDIAPLGLGCWAIGGAFFADESPLGFANTNDHEATEVIHAALDAGIRLFDTAAVYGAGHSERLLGRALMGTTDAIVVSKLGLCFDEQSKQVLGEDTDSANVMDAIDASLRRLQRDRIDIMLLHLNALPANLAAPILEKMEEARRAGKLRAYGWSTDYPSHATAFSSMPGFVAVEHAMNVFMDVPTIQSNLNEQNLIALIRSPLAMGVLTGKFTDKSVIAKDDVRSGNNDWLDYFQDGKVTPQYLQRLESVRELLQIGGRTLPQGALCWLLAKSSNNIPVPGARTVAQLKENAAAIELGPLPPAVMADIESLIQREPEGEPRAR